ncbi:Transposon Tn10 TetD protein [bacterium YEK0313]|nr:Transposon Tn10 TetD protein [bacterium YEK0313]
MGETSTFWRHPHFGDLGLMTARFTRHRYDLHTHPTYVIALITEGCERIRIDGRTILAPAGTVALVNPEECHDGEPGAEGGWAYRTFYPSVALMTGIAGELGRDRMPLFHHRQLADDRLAALLARAHAAAAEDDRVAAETTMLVALRHLLLRHADWGGLAGSSDRAGARRRFARYAALVDAGLDGDLSLGHLAQAADVTRFQVIRDFKAVTGLTPAAFIRDRRLRRADALIAGGASLAEAALAAGFADQSHLSRGFRATRGITPGMFRAGWHRA